MRAMKIQVESRLRFMMRTLQKELRLAAPRP
jgi:hypothetical protein